MKPSLYNFLVQIKGKKFIYNVKSGSVIPCSTEDYLMIQKAFQNIVNVNDKIKNKIKSDLINLGIFVEKRESEFLNLLEEKRNFIQSNKHICITIIVSENCNFQCLYCYQTHKNNTLKKQNIERIKKFINRLVRDKDTVSVLYFGGEPLLNPYAIEEIHLYIDKLSKHLGFKYYSKISTNGYLVDKNISLFNNINFDTIRITLDGSKETHDKLRKTKDGKETFHKIINNILLIKSPKIVIRVNLSSNSIISFENLCYILKDIDFKGVISIDIIESNPMKTFCSGEKSINYSSFISAAKRYNLNVINPLENRTVHCLFEVKDSYLVTPDANIYKCFVSELTYMGKIKQDGEIFRNIRAKKNMAKWESFSNVDQLCKKCKVYPLCAGGCVAKKIGGKNSCPIWKKEVSKLIELEIKNHNRFSIN